VGSPVSAGRGGLIQSTANVHYRVFLQLLAVGILYFIPHDLVAIAHLSHQIPCMLYWFLSMQLPNSERAIIAQEKLIDYVLNLRHKRGGSKARLLAQFGYTVDTWQQLDADIRRGLATDVEIVRLIDCQK
jgi:hypothetical protein